MGALLFAYPTWGLSHCLDQDKQLEIAHAETYWNYLLHQQTGYNTPIVDVSVALLLVFEFARFSRRRKRFVTSFLPLKYWPAVPFGLFRVVCKDTTILANDDIFCLVFLIFPLISYFLAGLSLANYLFYYYTCWRN